MKLHKLQCKLCSVLKRACEEEVQAEEPVMFLHPEVQFQGAAETFIFYVFTCIPFLKYMYTKKYYCYCYYYYYYYYYYYLYQYYDFVIVETTFKIEPSLSEGFYPFCFYFLILIVIQYLWLKYWNIYNQQFQRFHFVEHIIKQPTKYDITDFEVQAPSHHLSLGQKCSSILTRWKIWVERSGFDSWRRLSNWNLRAV